MQQLMRKKILKMRKKESIRTDDDGVKELTMQVIFNFNFQLRVFSIRLNEERQ